MPCEMLNICRTCLSMEAKLKSIEDINIFPDDSGEDLVNMLCDLTKTSKDEWISAQICTDCFFELMRCQRFKLKCINSHSTIIQLFGKCREHKSSSESEESPVDHNANKSLLKKQKNKYTNNEYSSQEDEHHLTSHNPTIQVQKEGQCFVISCVKENELDEQKLPTILFSRPQQNDESEKFVENPIDTRIHEGNIPNLQNDRKPRAKYKKETERSKQACSSFSDFSLCSKVVQHPNTQTMTKFLNGKNSVKCKFCPLTFSSQSKYDLHLKECLNYPIFRCKFCSKLFISVTGLTNHSPCWKWIK